MADIDKVIRGWERCKGCATHPVGTSQEYLDCEYTIGLYCGQDILRYETLEVLKECKEKMKNADDEWNLASEILPDEGERVLVFVEHPVYGKEVYMKRDITIGEYRNEKWRCSNFLGNRVIAWKPLPEHPVLRCV